MIALRLAAFAAIGAAAALQWGSLLAAPPTARLLGVVAVATLLGLLLSRIDPGTRPPRRRLIAVALSAAAALAALLLLGVPLGHLLPSGWDRLGAGIDEGLAGLRGAYQYPFDRSGEWARLLIVAPIAPLLIAAAILSFRPGRDRERVPVAGLVALVAAFAIPATLRPTAAPLLWGLGLLALIAIWLWGGRLRRATAVGLLAGVAAAAIPAAAGIAAADPPIDYESWGLPRVEQGISFNWEASSGPIAWPRTGRVMFRVHSERRSFWRADVLDSFAGAAWRRSPGGGAAVPGEPGPTLTPTTDPNRTRSAWFLIRGLESRLLISPGTPLAVDGPERVDRDRDGTTQVEGEPLRRGDSYSVTAWAPNPPAAKLRAASRRYGRSLASYRRLALATGPSRAAIASPRRVEVPSFGRRHGVALAQREIAGTAYDRVARLAARLTADARSGYGAARAIAAHLRSTYGYSEQPPRRRLPLRAFLFRDRIGYCQQFAGAMALMLRMIGVPARVTTGFAAGTPLANGHGYEVTDLDAHSWVEVYFNRIGWVPFDPTPATALSGATGTATPDGTISLADDGGKQAGEGAHNVVAAGAGDADGDGPPLAPFAILAALGALALAVPALRARRHRRLAPAVAAEREAEELRGALRASGWADERATTLLIAEDRLRRSRRPRAADYVGGFRDRLYGARPVPSPTLAERRSARRDLASGTGLRGHLRLLIAMPPGAPRPHR